LARLLTEWLDLNCAVFWPGRDLYILQHNLAVVALSNFAGGGGFHMHKHVLHAETFGGAAIVIAGSSWIVTRFMAGQIFGQRSR